jgi:N-acyl-D-aspartate/D-glutamate deacylase
MGKNSIQADFDGTPMVTDTMSDDDLLNLCQVLAERDEGFIEITHDTGNDAADRAFVERMAAVAKRPIIWNPVFAMPHDATAHRSFIDWLDEVNARGLRIFGQAATARSGFAMTMSDWNNYDSAPTWNYATTGTHAEKLIKLADPDVRVGLRDEIDDAGNLKKDGFKTPGGSLLGLVVQNVRGNADLLKYEGKSLGQIGKEEGKHVVDVLLDISLAEDLNVEFLQPQPALSNPANTAELIADSRYTFPGVSDGGAHTKFFNGGCFTTDFLLWLARDANVMTLEEAHYRLSALPAHAAGIRDRGTIREGAPADIVVYDLDGLAVEPHWIGEVVHDLPGGEWRRVNRAKGYRAILVNGEITFENGECTGATPGKLLRHGRADSQEYTIYLEAAE